MNQEQLQQKIAEYYGKLPESLQRFFADMSWINTLQEINAKYNLSGEQSDTLSTETTLALLCIIPMSEYVKTIESTIKIPGEQMDQFMFEINDRIFKDIGYELEDTFIKNINELAEEQYGGEKKLDERFSSLPKEVQDAISNSDYQSKLYSIAQNHKLSIEQMGVLEEITTKVMLNIIHPDQYEKTLSEKLGTSVEEAGNIANEVNEGILKTIREVLKMSFNKQESGKTETPTRNVANEDIPLPPYKVITNDQLLINNEKANTESKPVNPLEEKMIKPVSSTQTTSNYSSPKTTGSDPYREII